jgi:adenine/guanine phosphoribosyltransferase-like PRPP-binding protein
VSGEPPVGAGVLIGAYADAAAAIAGLGGVGGDRRRAAVLPQAAVDDQARVLLRRAAVECLGTLEGGDLASARWLARTLAETEGWELRDDGGAAAASSPGDVVGWYELRIGPGALATDRPITQLQGSRRYIASFNLLGQGRLNQACADLLYRRLVDLGIAPSEVFDVIVCSESKAVGMAQVVVECFGQDRYVVLRKGLKNYMPRRPRAPLVEESQSITTAGSQALVLDPLDWPLLEGRRVLLIDDVIATGGTVRAAHRLLEHAGATVTATAAVLLKGPEPEVPRLVVLARPLL